MTYSIKGASSPAVNRPSDGQDNDQHEAVLFGEDPTQLTELKDLGDGQPSGSLEGLNAGDLQPKDAVVAGCEGEGQCECGKPCVSRVIDAEGHARITIIFGPKERSKYLAQVISLIDAASENDIVDVTLVADLAGICTANANRSILSAIDRCKGTVITRAGALTTIGDIAIWLSGDQLQYGPMSAVFVRQMVAGFGGDIADFADKLEAAKHAYDEFSSYIAERGLFTKKELDDIYASRGMLSLHGEEFASRVANLKKVA